MISRNRRIAIIAGGIVLLVLVGLVGAYAGSQETEERRALLAPSGTPVQSLADCPWGEASCVLGLGIERALQFGNVDAVVDFGEPAFYDCPGRPKQGPGEPFPLCEGAPEFTRREGYPVAHRFGERSIVDEDGLREFIQAFVDAVEPAETDALGDGRLRLHAFGCPARATPFLNVSCARLAIILTAIVKNGEDTDRKLLVFWAVGLFGGETLPITEVWDGVILDSERTALLETGGYVSDLGEVYVIDQSLRRVPD
jgi:hypothetical protein